MTLKQKLQHDDTILSLIYQWAVEFNDIKSQLKKIKPSRKHRQSATSRTNKKNNLGLRKNIGLYIKDFHAKKRIKRFNICWYMYKF